MNDDQINKDAPIILAEIATELVEANLERIPPRLIRTLEPSTDPEVRRMELFDDAAMTGKPAPCPGWNGDEPCQETLEFERAEPEDRETGTPAWPGGYRCPLCLFERKTEPEDEYQALRDAQDRGEA